MRITMILLSDNYLWDFGTVIDEVFWGGSAGLDSLFYKQLSQLIRISSYTARVPHSQLNHSNLMFTSTICKPCGLKLWRVKSSLCPMVGEEREEWPQNCFICINYPVWGSMATERDSLA